MLLSERRSISGTRRGAGLGPAERVRRGAQYRRVYDEGRSYHGRALVLFVLERDGLNRQAGFVAGRKVGGAVERNRARRRMREAYRKLKDLLPPQGFQFVFVARAMCARNGLAGIEQEMRELLGRSGVIQR